MTSTTASHTITAPDGQVLGYAAQTGRDGTYTLHTTNGLCLVATAADLDEAAAILGAGVRDSGIWDSTPDTNEELVANLRTVGWDSATVEHLGGNVEAVKCTVSGYPLGGVAWPATILLLSHSEENDGWMLGVYRDGDEWLNDPIRTADGLVTLDAIVHALHGEDAR